MPHMENQPPNDAPEIAEIVQVEKMTDVDGTKFIVTHKHIHEYRGSGLMEAFLALLVAVLFLFGTVFLTFAAINFHQGMERSR